MRGLLIAGFLAVLVAGAAHGQPTRDAKDDTTGLFCVYNKLSASEHAGMVANVFLYDTAPEDDVDGAALVVNDAVRACAEAFMLSGSKAASAADMGIYGVAVDHLADVVRKEGANKRAIEKMFGVYDAFTDEELDKFEGEWRSDIEFSGKVKRSLISAGVPDKDAAIDAAFEIFEVSAQADQVVFLFLVDDL